MITDKAALIVSRFQFVPLVVHNLFYATLALMAGIFMQFIAIPLPAYILAAACIVAIGFIYKEYTGLTQWLFFIIPLASFAGSFLCYNQLQDQKNFQLLVAGNTVDIQATISSIEPIQNPRFRYKITIDLEKIKRTEEKNWQEHNKSIALYVTSMPKILVGDLIEVKNLKFKEIANQSFKNYLAKEKIVATLFIDKFECTVLHTPSFSLNRTISYFRETIFKELRKKINKETFQLFSSIFLGNRSSVKKEMDATKEPFKIWGTSHYLARSGLHLVIFVLVWHFILSLIPISYRIKQLFLIMLILIYTLLSWSSVSFERALLMFLVYKICLLTRTPSHYVHLIVLVTFIVLCFNPLQLFFLDFQLSFGLTFALAWFNHIETHKKKPF